MIDKFRGKYWFLSNFYESPIEDENITYSTVEHYFQAQKTLNREEKLKIAKASKPAKAKKMGRQVNLRKDWEDIKLQVMEKALRLKFQNPDLRKKLIATGDEELIEGNQWGDRYWGVCNGSGKNKLGKLLMKIRKELQEE
ncbi:NADAR family protein [Methanobrevibacter woesei]|uniref:NADAR family protein n=1 Tax=Methanobrevibacter woesei TaxID=190976 RepID=UPI0039F4A630